MKKILSIFLILILLTGCGKKDAYYYKDISDTVISLFKDLNYNTKDFSKKENEAINKIISELTHENQKIDVSKYIRRESQYKVYESNSSEIFIENGKCYVYYNDLGYEEYANDESHYEMEPHKKLVCDGYYTILYESYFYPKYELVQKDPVHNYAYINYNKTSDGYSYIYKSTYNGEYLVIDINTDELEINLSNTPREDEIVIEKKKSGLFGIILSILIVSSSLVAVLTLLLKNKKNF